MMSDNFVNVFEDSLDYFMSHKYAGRCVVFDHEHFDEPKKRRHGTKVDVHKIESFFGDRLGFTVTTYNDLTRSQMISNFDKLAKEDFTHFNCLVCCILTHGNETNLEAKDGDYRLDSVISFFTSDYCKSLAGKPKLFFIQACQGTKTDPGHEIRVLSSGNMRSLSPVTDSVVRDVADGDNTRIVSVKIPIFADILVAYSTLPKHFSFRNPDKGSWFFEVLIQTLEEHHKQHDLTTILTITKRRIAFEKTSNTRDQNLNNKKQIPWITDTLTRRVFFKNLGQLRD